MAEAVGKLDEEAGKRPPSAKANAAEGKDLRETLKELQSRIGALYTAVSQSTGSPTTDQRQQLEYCPTLMKTLEPRVRALVAVKLVAVK